MEQQDIFCYSERISQERINEVIAHAFKGIITVIDKTGTVVYSQNIPNTSMYPSSVWVDQPIEKWLDNGVLTSSPSLRSLQSKQMEICFIRETGKHPLISFASPLLDKNGEVEFVVAFNFPEQLIHRFSDLISSERNRAKQLVRILQAQENNNTFLLTQDKRIKSLLAVLDKVAETDTSIMFTGETGVGKEVFSRYVHSRSARAKEIFIPVNCAAIPAELIESEFFGYDRGAFTGASKDGKAGLFELAHGGTLFLDEVGEMPLSMQSKLLQVLESGEYRKVGGNKICKSDVRIISATNRDLRQMVKEHTFREDLFYRLNIVPIRIPPLRERQDDIIPLAKFFLDRLNKKYGTAKIFYEDTLHTLLSYSWPGNVRELSNVVEQLYVTTAHGQITVPPILGTEHLLSSANHTPAAAVQTPGPAFSVETGLSLKETMRHLEEEYVRAVLDSCGGKVALAAERLQLTKAGLYKKLESYKNTSGDHN